MPASPELTADRPRMPALAAPRVAVRHPAAIAVLVLTLLSFLMPSAPTYDPWAWIIWGREILHLDLSTVDGPSWKPLPVLLTTPFALFGGLAPDLWLFVARAGAIAGMFLAFGLARRLAGVTAGAAAAAAYALAPWTLRNGAMGNSEGLLVALALAAVDRHLAGRPRQAFLLGLGAALLRPEAWPLLGLYGLWLLWREPKLRRLVLLGFASLPPLWLLPELWGSGDLFRAANRARNPNPNSAAFADNPAAEVVRQFTSLLSTPIWIGLGALVVAVVLRRVPGRREERAAAALLIGGLIWVAEVAVMTNDGFSGNSRYLIMPAALACVLAGVGVGWIVRALPVWRLVPVLAVGAAVAFGVPNLDRLEPVHRGLKYQAHLTDGLADAVARAGGRERLLACGEPYAGPFQVPVVAWNLRVHTSRVRLDPQPPGVAFRASNTGGRPGPPLDGLGGEAGVRTFAIAGGWRIVGRCR